MRGIILGTLAFVAAFFAERQLRVVSTDIARYNALRVMSDEPVLIVQCALMLRDFLRAQVKSRNQTLGIFDAVQNDVLRYARISTM